MSENNVKPIVIKNNTLSFGKENKSADSTDSQWRFTFKAKPGQVAIVYPSLCSPMVKKSSDPLCLYVLTDDAFKETFDVSSNLAVQIVNTYLKFEPWGEYRANQSSVEYNKRPEPKDEPLCEDWGAAEKNITIKSVGEFSELEGQLKNKDENLFGQIHPNAQQWYLSNKLKHLFMIEINASNNHVTSAKNQDLFALSWRVPTESDDAQFEQCHDQLIQQYNKKYINKEKDRLLGYKISDELQFEDDTETPMQSHHPVYIYDGDYMNLGQLTDVHVSSRQHAFEKGGACVVDGVTEKIGSHVNKAYTPLKKLMDTFGTDSDTHLLIFTGDLVDYGQNFDPSSDMGKNIKTSGDLWDAMDLDHLSDEALYPKSIDLRIMYSLFMHYYDTYNKPILLVNGNHEAYTLPYGISPRVKGGGAVWRSTKDFLGNVSEGIRSGWNSIATLWDDDVEVDPHEMRDLTDLLESESERRKEFIDDALEDEVRDGTRANEGIPADHNLTLYEACLMYGPDYGRVVLDGGTSGGLSTNFNPENFNWFYILFTPISDIWFSIGKQTVMGLYWGDGEKMASIMDGPIKTSEVRADLEREGRNGFKWDDFGILPQSTESLTDAQVNIITMALQQKSTFNILCSHFTIANYDVSLSYEVQDEKSIGQYIPRQAPVSVGGLTSRNVTAHYNIGTFLENRTFLMQDCIQKGNPGKIHLTLSGHSHRAGLYQDIGTKPTFSQNIFDWAGSGEDMIVQPHIPLSDGRYDYQPKPDKSLFLVSASGGSMPVQNYRGEMIGMGMAPPSGSSVKFNDGTPEIKVIEYNKGSSKPRFAVAMDFMDVLGPGKTIDKEGVFDRFECVEDITEKTKALELIIQVNQRRFPDVPIFKSGRIHIFLDEEKVFVTLPFEVVFEGEHLHKAIAQNTWLSEVNKWSFSILQKAQKTKNNLYFIELSFDDSDLSKMIGYQQYNYDSSWYIQMQIKPRESLTKTARGLRRKTEPGFVFERDENFGEVPSFDWRAKRNSTEYNLPAKYSRK